MTLTASELIQIRRQLHEIPEPALREFKTHDKLLEVISNFDQKYLTVRPQEEVLPTAIFVLVQGSHPKRTIGWRTDIDALPVEEKTGLSFSSKNPGFMHACGHDIHMTVALGLLSYFSTNQPKDNMLFFFQPAEESQSGGKIAYDHGLFDGKWTADEWYAIHDNPNLPAGSIGCRNGTLFAGTTEVNIDIYGKGGHAAFPHLAKDSVVAMASLIMQLQTIVSRSVNPIEGGVLTLGHVEAGTIRNVIADHARVEGTIRGLTQKMIEHIDQRVREICKGIEMSFGVKIELSLVQDGCLPVENTPELTQRAIDYFENNSDVEYYETQPAMTGEDFGFMLSKYPGTMFWLGVDGGSQLHSATMTPKEESLEKGINALSGFLEYRMQN